MKFHPKKRNLTGWAGLHGGNWLESLDSKNVVTKYHTENQLDSLKRTSYPIVKNAEDYDDDHHPGCII